MIQTRIVLRPVAVFMLLFGGLGQTLGQDEKPCCEALMAQPGIIWYGSNPKMTFEQLAAYAGPIISFSPDEPLLEGTEGADIRLPEPVYFEEDPDAPVVYYRVKTVLSKASNPGVTVQVNEQDRNQSVLNLSLINAIDLDYFFYYTREAGLGAHPHDIESAQFKLEIIQNTETGCENCRYAIRVAKIVALAHGLHWYDNVLVVDEPDVKFPMTIMQEEGKHASCPDRNGDGLYSPGYDVNRRVNDAWAIRDVIRSGSLITGDYKAWMSKYRWPEYNVVPPLPKDSPLYDGFVRDRRRLTEDKAVYVLRPFPRAELATEDPKLKKLIAEKGSPDWPKEEYTAGEDVIDLLTKENFLGSISISYRYDGHHGISVGLPLLILKNVELPMTGGWAVHRIYLTNAFQNFGYTLLMTPSASRWLDGYFAVGAENNLQEQQQPSEPGKKDFKWEFLIETGIKFRFNVSHSFLRPLRKIGTEFWGIRFGVRNFGFPNINRLAFVVEVGAGVW